MHAVATETATIICDRCTLAIPPRSGMGGVGYGVDPKTGKRYCYACCGLRDSEDMASMAPGERISLYLNFTEDPEDRQVPEAISNWPGSLSFQVPYYAKGRHNWGLTRWDVWFTHGGAWWWGVQYGEFTQLVHCRKLKARPRWMLP